MIRYTFNVTEKDSNNFITTRDHTGNASLTMDGNDGLLPDQAYVLIVEAENIVGSTSSEKIPFCESISSYQRLTLTLSLWQNFNFSCYKGTGRGLIFTG